MTRHTGHRVSDRNTVSPSGSGPHVSRVASAPSDVRGGGQQGFDWACDDRMAGSGRCCGPLEFCPTCRADASFGDAIAEFRKATDRTRFATVLADPPWQFVNRTGKVAPEHRRLNRYDTLTLHQICAIPVKEVLAPTAHLYLWVPNALLPDGLRVLQEWGFEYKSNIIWHKLRKDGGSDGRGVGFYFRNVTEILLFGVRGKKARTLQPGRTQVNYIGTRKREHSRKPDEQYSLIEGCSPGPRLEMFSRGVRPGWTVWGNQADPTYEPSWETYAHNSASERRSSRVAE